MFDAIQRYVHERRRGLVRSAAYLCGSYVVSSYITDRLEEIKDRTVRNKFARDNLRRRFQSTHDDVCFTIMALIPTLASQILEDMDVEALTNELQSMSRASRSRTLHPSQNQHRSQSVSSVSDVQSDAGSLSISSYSGSVFDGERASAISTSWVEHVSSSQAPISPSDVPAQLSDSFTSASTSRSHDAENSMASSSTRTKGQLWNEVKMLSLTRTLTTLYAITLLSLFTAVQLNLLGRSRYIDSVRASDRAERARDDVPHLSVTEVLLKEMMGKFVDLEAIWPSCFLGESDDGDDGDETLDAIPGGTELPFLTLSWWVLHVGWKDVAARVRSSVESVFDNVSLKVKLSASELSALIMDVRQRVEMDAAGSKLSERFVSSLLPPTRETTTHVLAQGGALPTSRENEIPARAKSDSHNPTRSPRMPGDIMPSVPPPPSKTPRDGLSRATAIPVESPVPRHSTFPTPPSSHAHASDLSSCASQSPSNHSVPRLQPAQPLGMFGSLAASSGTLNVDSKFNALLEETRLYLSGPDFAHALVCALDRATEVLMDGLRERVFVDTAVSANVPISAQEVGGEAQAPSGAGEIDKTGTEAGSEKEEVKVRLAGLLPGLARWCQLALNATPNELVDNIMAVREVNALEAIVISDYEARFPRIS